jgi:hypothetical protein
MEFLEQFFVMGLTLGRGDSSKSFRAFSLYVESYFHSVFKCHFHGFCKVFSLPSWGFHEFLLLSFFSNILGKHSCFFMLLPSGIFLSIANYYFHPLSMGV